MSYYFQNVQVVCQMGAMVMASVMMHSMEQDFVHVR